MVDVIARRAVAIIVKVVACRAIAIIANVVIVRRLVIVVLSIVSQISSKGTTSPANCAKISLHVLFRFRG